MNEIETIKKKIIDDLSAISDKDILEYIAERMAIHAEDAVSLYLVATLHEQRLQLFHILAG